MKALSVLFLLFASGNVSCSSQTKSPLKNAVDCSVTGACKQERTFRGDGGGICMKAFKKANGSTHTSCYEFSWERMDHADPTQEIQAAIKNQCTLSDPDLQGTFVAGAHCPSGSEYSRCTTSTGQWGQGVIATLVTHADSGATLTEAPPACSAAPL